MAMDPTTAKRFVILVTNATRALGRAVQEDCDDPELQAELERRCTGDEDAPPFGETARVLRKLRVVENAFQLAVADASGNGDGSGITTLLNAVHDEFSKAVRRAGECVMPPAAPDFHSPALDAANEKLAAALGSGTSAASSQRLRNGAVGFNPRASQEAMARAIEWRDSLGDSLSDDANNKALQVRLRRWRNAGKDDVFQVRLKKWAGGDIDYGWCPTGATSRLIAQMRPRAGLSPFATAYQQAMLDTHMSPIGERLATALEAVKRELEAVIDEAEQKYQDSGGGLGLAVDLNKAIISLGEIVGAFVPPDPTPVAAEGIDTAESEQGGGATVSDGDAMARPSVAILDQGAVKRLEEATPKLDTTSSDWVRSGLMKKQGYATASTKSLGEMRSAGRALEDKSDTKVFGIDTARRRWRKCPKSKRVYYLKVDLPDGLDLENFLSEHP